LSPNWSLHHPAHKSPSLYPILSQLLPIHTDILFLQNAIQARLVKPLLSCSEKLTGNRTKMHQNVSCSLSLMRYATN